MKHPLRTVLITLAGFVAVLAVVLPVVKAARVKRLYYSAAAEHATSTTDVSLEPSVLLDDTGGPPPAFGLEWPSAVVMSFLAKLESIATANRWFPVLASERSHGRYYRFTSAYALQRVTEGSTNYFAVLQTKDTSVPGEDEVLIFIVDSQGRLIDQVGCQINNRTTVSPKAVFHAVLADDVANDGADVIVRLDGVSNSGNFDHYVIYKNVRYSFYWGGDAKDGPSVWDEKGLLRIRVRQGKMQILHPDFGIANRRYELRPAAQPEARPYGSPAAGSPSGHP